MADLIDRKVAHEMLIQGYDLRDVPAVFEVIRCADCKYQATAEDICDICGTNHKYCTLYDTHDETAPDEHFCGWAERKDGAENEQQNPERNDS